MPFTKALTWKNALLPLAICLALLGICCIPGVTDQILALDYNAFYRLNPLVANSPVIDRLIRLFAAEGDRLRLLLPLFIGLAIYLYLSRDAMHRYRKIAFLLYMTAIIAISLLAEKQIDILVNRHSPSFSVHSYENLRQIYGWKDFTPKERHTFPSDEALILVTVGLTLIYLRSRKWGFAAIALGFIASFARCIAGTTWLSDIYLGAFPMAFLLSVGATKTPFARLLPWLEQTVITTADQAQVLRRKIRPILRIRKWPFDVNQTLHLEIAVKRYVRRNIAEDLGFPPDQKPHITIEMPLYGMRSLVRKVTVDDQSVILRIFPNHRNGEAYHHKLATDLLLRHQVRAPRVLNIKPNKRTGALFMLEEYIEGTYVHGSTMTDSQLEAVTGEYARMHSARNSHWGPPDMIRMDDYFATLIRRAKRQLARIRPLSGRKAAAFRNERKLVLDWLESWRDLVEQVPGFFLMHNNLHRENGLIMADGSYCLLDNSTLEWGIPAKDISLVHSSLCEGNPEIIARFNESYYSKLPEDIRQPMRQLSRFYDVLLMLSFLSRSVERLTGKKDDIAALDKQVQRWQIILETASTPPISG